MNVCFNCYGENVLTFETNGEIAAGDPVMITGNGVVQKANGDFCGICVSVRNGFASVQLDGFARVGYSVLPEVGFCKLSAEAGKIKADNSNGREFLVVDVDTAAQTAGIIL